MIAIGAHWLPAATARPEIAAAVPRVRRRESDQLSGCIVSLATLYRPLWRLQAVRNLARV